MDWSWWINAIWFWKGTHHAIVNVFDETGSLISTESAQSGNMTPSEKALGFPQSTLATHTEARAVKKTPLQPGHRMEILGQYPPCSNCKGKMRGASSGGAIVDYKWMDDAGKSQHVRFEKGKKTIDTTSKNKKFHPKCN